MAATYFPATGNNLTSNIAGYPYGAGARVFYQRANAAIHVLVGQGNNVWSGGDGQLLVAPGVAMMNTPIAPVGYLQGPVAIARCFFLAPSGQIWVASSINGQISYEALQGGVFVAATYSQLGAIVWMMGGVPHIKIYYQTQNNQIQEIGYDGAAYYAGHTFPPPQPGTCLAFINKNGKDQSPSIRGYYQHMNIIMEVCWDQAEGWRAGTFINGYNRIPDRACIVACTAAGQTNVYWSNADNSVSEDVCANNAWSGPRLVPALYTPPGCRFMAMSTVPGAPVDVRIIFMTAAGTWSDRRFEKGQWIPANDSASIGPGCRFTYCC